MAVDTSNPEGWLAAMLQRSPTQAERGFAQFCGDSGLSPGRGLWAAYMAGWRDRHMLELVPVVPVGSDLKATKP